MQIDDDIAALASPPGSAGRGVIRICGSGLSGMIEESFEPGFVAAASSSRIGIPKPARRLEAAATKGAQRFTGWWRLADCPAKIPCDLWYWPSHRSYAGQPTAELHLPGSPPLLERVLEDLHRRGIRPARPGEFTLRAFLAGKIDLVQAEAVLGVIDAHDDAELRTALSQLAGGISRHLMWVRNDLLELLADLEAGLDFVEEDISFVSRSEIQSRLSAAVELVQRLISQSDSRMTSATRKKVVLAGLPNAGKSTLFNRLAGREMALVSPVEGTTTDYLRAEVCLGGVECELIDTAGWETKSIGIPAAAQRQRLVQFERAHLILWCTASDLDESKRSLDDTGFQVAIAGSTPAARLRTKCDLPVDNVGGRRKLNQGADAPRSEDVRVSASLGDGMETLASLIARHLTDSTSRSSAWLGTTSTRCRDSLQHALVALKRAEAAASEANVGEELLAVDLREALDHLGEVVGAVYTDDLLDRIFSKFCIGK